MTVVNLNNTPYFTRNPKSIGFSSAVYVGNHTVTTRFTYTVPVGRMAIVDHCSVGISVNTAPSTSGFASNNMSLNIYLSASVRLLFVQFSPAAINLNGYIQSLLANAATLFADDSIVVYDSDTSTGGASTYITDLHIIEMDAY